MPKAKRLKALKDDETRLKKLLAVAMLREVASKTS